MIEVTGFVRPAPGSVHAFGDDLLSIAHYRRARWGLRRTFQTEQAIDELSVFDNVALVHEHAGAPRASRRADVLDAISFAGLDVDPAASVSTLGLGQRRLVEARCASTAVLDCGELIASGPAARVLRDERVTRAGASSPRRPASSRC